MSTGSDPKVCPYVGLEPFEPAHAEFFFGRQLDSKVLADHVGARPVTVLYGPSGIGKSSLINVGLPAALSQISQTAISDPEGNDDVELPPNWMTVYWREWRNPARLAQDFFETVTAAIPKDHRPSPGVSGSMSIATIGEAMRSAQQPFLLILDQFEEYFLYREPNANVGFESGIGALALRRDLPVHILFALREDGLHLLDQLRAFIPSIMETTIELGPLSDPAVEEAIREPIARYNAVYRKDLQPITIEDDLVAELVHQLKETDTALVPRAGLRTDQSFVELPYLQLVLTKLWAADIGPEASILRKTTLRDRLGGVRKIVEDHVDSVMSKLPREERDLCFRCFDRLVTPIGSKVAYPTAALADRRIINANVTQDQVQAVLNKLTPKEARILKPVNINGLEGFELFHDVLGPAVLNWTQNYNFTPTAGTRFGPLPYSTVCFELRDRPGLIVGYKTGAIDNIHGASIWVNSENTDMLMDRVVGRSISSRIRLLGSNKDEDGNIIEDTIAEALREAVGRQGHVRIGTVLETTSGSLKQRGVERILHVATVQAQTSQGGGVKADLNTLASCVTFVLERAEKINKNYWNICKNFIRERFGLKPQYSESILVPIIGAGEGGLSVEDVTQAIIPAAIEHLSTVQLPTLQKVFFLAFDTRAKAACDAVLEKAAAKGVLVKRESE